MWSLGVVLYAMVTGRLPFRGSSNRSTQEEILIANPHYPSELSRDLVDLLRSMLNPDRALRATISDILKSEWLINDSVIRHSSSPAILGRAALSPVSRKSTSPEGSASPIGSPSPLPRIDDATAVSASPPPSRQSFLQKYRGLKRILPRLASQ